MNDVVEAAPAATGDRWRIVQGDCLESLRELPDSSVDAVVTDPPYGLSEHRPEEVAACDIAARRLRWASRGGVGADAAQAQP